MIPVERIGSCTMGRVQRKIFKIIKKPTAQKNLLLVCKHSQVLQILRMLNTTIQILIKGYYSKGVTLPQVDYTENDTFFLKGKQPVLDVKYDLVNVEFRLMITKSSFDMQVRLTFKNTKHEIPISEQPINYVLDWSVSTWQEIFLNNINYLLIVLPVFVFQFI